MDTQIRNLITSMIVFSYICHKDPKGLKKIMDEYLKIEKDPESREHIEILMKSVDIGIDSENFTTNVQQEDQKENIEPHRIVYLDDDGEMKVEENFELAKLSKELFGDEPSGEE